MATEGLIESGDHSRSLGNLCDDLGLTKDNFLDKLAQLVPDDLTNGHIHELFVHIQASKIPWKHILDCLCQVYAGLEGSSEANIRNSFENVKKKRAN